MLDRFNGINGPRRVREAILEQKCVAHSEALADALLQVHELLEFQPGENLMLQGGHDNDIYFLLAGSVSIQVNGREVSTRSAGLHVGEMALIEHAATRSATVVAKDAVVAAKVSEPDFANIAEQFPFLWRRLAMVLGERLRERSKQVRSRNSKPILFVGSSVEGLAVAKEIHAGLRHNDFLVHIWSNGVFTPGNYTMEDLEAKIGESDFGIIVCTQDDRILNEDRGLDSLAPRDNCILELGMCIGQLGRGRTILVRPRSRDFKIPTDLLGITPIEYSTGTGSHHLSSAIGPVCTDIEKIINEKFVR